MPVQKSLNYFQFFLDESHNSKMSNWKQKFQLFICYNLFTKKKCPRTSTIHLGILLRWELWADGVSPQMNTTALSDRMETHKNQRKFSGEL